MNAILPIERKRIHHFRPEDLRVLLRQNLGLNSKQVTVRRESSNTYLTVTLRDPAVDIVRLDQFVRSVHTWEMDNTDYVTGQSVHLAISPDVRAVLVAPYLAEAVAMIDKLRADPEIPAIPWADGSSGVVLYNHNRDFWLEMPETKERRAYLCAFQLDQAWMAPRLAWDFYSLTKGIRP